ncbi:MAG: 4a-hydroxytetrahydrobiopterin dehydratase [Legionellaceae bacterium]|nr:4a-hydroxytetrahydrobiopterin dehydratase [Legionellaceae bacterium]
MMNDLVTKHCEPCEGIGNPLNREQIDTLMPQLESNWRVSDDLTTIHRAYSFDNFHETMAFMNAIAWIAHRENHHPDIELGYNYCRVSFMTHALKGLSHNDFICASKIDQVLQM